MAIETKAERHARLQRQGVDRLFEWCNAERGRTAKLAVYLGLTQGAFTFWNRVMAERLGEVANFTGIPREELRPDLFEPPEDDSDAEERLENSA